MKLLTLSITLAIFGEVCRICGYPLAEGLFGGVALVCAVVTAASSVADVIAEVEKMRREDDE